MKAPTVNPIAEVMLVVNACQHLQKRFAGHAIPAQKYYLAVDGSR